MNLIGQDDSRDADPREAILAVADKAESNPYWTAAYAKYVCIRKHLRMCIQAYIHACLHTLM